MSKRLDHSKGGNYTPDPARIQRHDDFVEPDGTVVGRKNAPTGVWERAIKAFQSAKKQRSECQLSQKELLSNLGISKKNIRWKDWGAVLKRLVDEGIILNDGRPNPDHPTVIEVIRKTSKR